MQLNILDFAKVSYPGLVTSKSDEKVVPIAVSLVELKFNSYSSLLLSWAGTTFTGATRGEELVNIVQQNE